MASGQGVTNYIDIDDFTAGVAQGWRAVSYKQPSELGTAQLGGTWGCVGPPEGGLVPAPLRFNTAAANLAVGGAPPISYPQNVRIMDILAWPGFLWDSAGPNADGYYKSSPSVKPPDVVAVVTGQFINNSGTTQYVYQTRVYHAQKQRWATLDSVQGAVSGTSIPTYGAGWATLVQSARGDGTFFSSGLGPTVDPFDAFGFQHLVTNSTYQRQITGVALTTRRTVVYPDPTTLNPTTRTYGSLPSGSGSTNDEYPHVWRRRPFTHQGRLCFTSTKSDITEFGSFPQLAPNTNEGAFFVGDEQIRYHGVNAIQNAEGIDYANLDYGSTASMVASVGSLNASTLLLVMSNGGGIVVSGALDLNPQISRYPQVQSAGFNPTHPAMTPLGMVYGTNDGVYAWNGSDNAQKLSPKLEGRFWTKSSWSSYVFRGPDTPLGRFAYEAPFLYAPYNWIMDTRTGGWWRVYPTTEQDDFGVDLGNFTASGTGTVWGASMEQAQGSSSLFHMFSHTRGADKWKWTSQPMAIGRNRFAKIREVNVVVQGLGNMDITVQGVSGVGTTKTIAVTDGGQPRFHRVEFDEECQDPVIILKSTGPTEAPRLYRMSIGYREDRSI
jgi:hypothetical protein